MEGRENERTSEQMNKRKKSHIEVAVPPKNKNLSKLVAIKFVVLSLVYVTLSSEY